MKFKVLLITVVFFVSISKVLAIQPPLHLDDENTSKNDIMNTDSLMHGLFSDTIATPKTPTLNSNSSVDKTIIKVDDNKTIVNPEVDKTINLPVDTKITDLKVSPLDTIIQFNIPVKIHRVPVDSLLFVANPFFVELVYEGLPFDFKWDVRPDFRELYYGRKATTLSNFGLKPIDSKSAEQTVAELRQYAREQILRKAANLYVMTFDDLPDPEDYKSRTIEGKSIKNIRFDTDDEPLRHRRLVVRREKLGPWVRKGTALLQFTQNYISPNWYQGGNSNIAILGIVTGQLNYDDKKNIQWENSGEWHIGFNSVAGDSIRPLSTNDDVFKINSKLGVKAGGNWFYSGTVDFSTQFFNSYNGINSTVMVTSFLTPVRLNVGVGLDYKYKKIFSLMLAPVAYKYIYVSSSHVDPNLFGVKTGERILSEIGSSFNSILSYPVTREIQIDSKLNFYTNYKSVEIDWELVCNLTINRFMSTRISINPRYDNTVIFAPGDYAKPQFKQLMSVGFFHKFH